MKRKRKEAFDAINLANRLLEKALLQSSLGTIKDTLEILEEPEYEFFLRDLKSIAIRHKVWQMQVSQQFITPRHFHKKLEAIEKATIALLALLKKMLKHDLKRERYVKATLKIKKKYFKSLTRDAQMRFVDHIRNLLNTTTLNTLEIGQKNKYCLFEFKTTATNIHRIKSLLVLGLLLGEYEYTNGGYITFLTKDEYLENYYHQLVEIGVFDLSYMNLSSINFKKLDLAGADLRSVDLSKSNLESINLEGGNLTAAKLRRSNLNNANLIDAKMSECNLIEANLRNAFLNDADLSHSDLRKADCYAADFTWADLSAVNFRSASLINANLQDAHLYNANLSGADLTNADLREADLTNAHLVGCNLSRANLNGAKLDKEEKELLQFYKIDLDMVEFV